ncbi:transposase [Spirochaetia bacterium]|nr:transposase [Spirochaetia bacterium]
MEDVLDVYKRPRDEKHPVVCMDECPKQLIGEIRTPIPAQPGRPECFDTEYIRNGTCDIFMFVAPLEGWRRAEITEQRTCVDWANQIKKLVDVDFVHAEKITLVMDNLNTHAIASLYKAFPPEEANRIRNRLEIHYTPKHGSWLNMAEIELSVINNHGLSDRIPTIEQMRAETDAWNIRRNKDACKIDWQFTTADARIKLKRLYPQFTS